MAEQRQEARGQLSSPVYSGNTDLKRFHFSTVFVAVLLQEQGFLRVRPAFQGHTESSPALASGRKHHVFNLRVPARRSEQPELQQPGCAGRAVPGPAATGNLLRAWWSSRSPEGPLEPEKNPEKTCPWAAPAWCLV